MAAGVCRLSIEREKAPVYVLTSGPGCDRTAPWWKAPAMGTLLAGFVRVTTGGHASRKCPAGAWAILARA